MKRDEQKQIISLVSTISKATDAIKILFLRGDKATFIQLLGDCQDTVLQLIDFIEGLEGEGTQTVAHFEEFYKTLYEASVEDCDSGSIASIERLQKLIRIIENSINTEFKPKIEVVFFPYKASMWDSLESIWIAANEDPNCDAYVVPIPYFDKLPEGSFGQMHYEGDFYPEYVPIVDWRKYNIESRHPDAIFIHNPYDNGNYVTSVHPNYYSERLRKLTDMLIYVPYFVTAGDVQKYHCYDAACIYSNYVFVQSEEVRSVCIKTFESEFGDIFGNPKDKFIAFGTPKYDAILNAKYKDYTLPKEWVDIINNKKIIFYNTSLSTILQNSGTYLKKLRNVIDVFRRRNDVALWWRPHPLSESTFSSMFPQLLNEYQQIIEEYRNEKFAIYDDTENLHRAIAMSDAYFGDGSSLVFLCGLAEKIIMIQKVDVVATEEYVDFEYIIEDTMKINAEDKSMNKFFYNILESKPGSLNAFINYVIKMDKDERTQKYIEEKTELFRNTAVNSDGSSGKKIYDFCKKTLLED